MCQGKFRLGKFRLEELLHQKGDSALEWAALGGGGVTTPGEVRRTLDVAHGAMVYCHGGVRSQDGLGDAGPVSQPRELRASTRRPSGAQGGGGAGRCPHTQHGPPAAISREPLPTCPGHGGLPRPRPDVTHDACAERRREGAPPPGAGGGSAGSGRAPRRKWPPRARRDQRPPAAAARAALCDSCD